MHVFVKRRTEIKTVALFSDIYFHAISKVTVNLSKVLYCGIMAYISNSCGLFIRLEHVCPIVRKHDFDFSDLIQLKLSC